ncbi:PPE domain-containing protein [Amycolatopsis sp. GM8]|uniref:PPE domain-containing protein n=1 Tax=Amycolatopsis sp. GM8 TaxID=2896530 RepID=UPI001F24FAF4|nr:PPE domain-containing protein [Amycolatopsis sp. GM8]
MAAGDLPYNTHRKHRYYGDDHPMSAKQRARIRRLDRIQRANQRDASFGKINWAAYEHRQLWDMIHTADPAALGSAAHSWAALAVQVDSATAEVHKTVQKLLLSWRGDSAVQAASSASKLTAWAAEASAGVREVGDGLDTYTNAIVNARNHMPEPVYYSAERHFREGYDVKASGPDAAVLADQLLDDHLPTQRETDRAKAEAVRVMDRYEAASKGVHDKLPSFTDAPEVVTGDQPGWGVEPPAAQAPGGSGDSHDGTSASAATGVPATGGFGSGASGFGAGAGSVPGVSGGAGGAGLGAGSSVGSGALPTGPAGPGGAAAAAAAGARGGGGAGMMMPPGAAGRQGEDAGEHHNRYATDSGLDLLDDLPPAYPPVLGE